MIKLKQILNEQGKSLDADGNPRRAPNPLTYKFDTKTPPNVFDAEYRLNHARLKLKKVTSFASSTVLHDDEKQNEESVKAFHEAERLVFEAITALEKIGISYASRPAVTSF